MFEISAFTNSSCFQKKSKNIEIVKESLNDKKINKVFEIQQNETFISQNEDVLQNIDVKKFLENPSSLFQTIPSLNNDVLTVESKDKDIQPLLLEKVLSLNTVQEEKKNLTNPLINKVSKDASQKDLPKSNKDDLKKISKLKTIESPEEGDQSSKDIFEKDSIRSNYVEHKVKEAQFGIKWSMLTDVVNSGIKSLISPREKHLQEAMFEMISSEAKYYSGLEVIRDHYYNSYLFSPKNDKFGYVNPIDKHHVFSNIISVMEVSKKILTSFETRWKEDRPFLHDVCDILYHHACSAIFKNYVDYIRNQAFQQQSLTKLMESSIIKKEMERLQSFEGSRGLTLDGYLLLPFQRLTRYKLLAENILKVLLHESINQVTYKTQIENANKAIKQISFLLSESQKGKTDLDNKLLLLDLLPKLDFTIDCKVVSLNNKILLKESEYDIDPCKQKHGPQLLKKSVFFVLLLFNDIMMIGKRNGPRIQILDCCVRKDVVFSSRVNAMLNSKTAKKNVYIINDPEDEESIRFYLKFENSCSKYLSNPIILKVENRDEILSWEKVLPDHNNRDIFDYKLPCNYNYWKNVKKLDSFTKI